MNYVRRLIFKTTYFFFGVVLIFISLTLPGKVSGAGVEKKGEDWVISGNKTQALFDYSTFGVDVIYKDTKWNMSSDQSYDLHVFSGKDTLYIPITSARVKQVEPYTSGYFNGIKVHLDRFSYKGYPFNIQIALVLLVETTTDEVIIQVIKEGCTDGFLECLYPRNFILGKNLDRSYTVVPQMQGLLIPSDWKKEINVERGQTYTRWLYMQWFGAIRDNEGYIGILETPYDAGISLNHPAGGQTVIRPYWTTTMQTFGYNRSIRYSFFTDCNYVTLAKRYRDYVIETRTFRSLKEKSVENPRVAKLKGSIELAFSAYTYITPQSRYYSKDDPSKNESLTTFAENTALLENMRKVFQPENAIVHLDGWGKRGYDNLHPDILPPAEKAGGWDGLKTFAEACEKSGYLFCTHDNYIDYYHDAETWNKDKAVMMRPNGPVYYNDVWYGGAHSHLNPMIALGYVKRNFQEILDHNIPLRATYLDVFSIIKPEEDYNAFNRNTREESCRWRAACFNYVRSLGIVTSSEEPCDWSVPYLDFVYWAPYAMDKGLFNGEFTGIPVPLFTLVYHDALVIPWNLADWSDSISVKQAFLHALMNGGIAHTGVPDNIPAEWIQQVSLLTKVHSVIGFDEMVNHEFLNPERTIQKTAFAGGVTITTDFNNLKFCIQGMPGIGTEWQDVP